MATRVHATIGRIQRRVLHRDVRRIADHRVILPPQQGLHLRQVLAGVGMSQARARVMFGALEHAFGRGQAETRTVQQAVADGHVQPKIRRFR